MQLLMVQRASGGLTIGDTHEYDEPFDFAVDETLYERLRERAESILGTRLPHIVRRWSGTYSVPTDDRLYYRHWIDHGVCVVTGRPAGDDPGPGHCRGDLGRSHRMIRPPFGTGGLDMAGTTVLDDGVVEYAFHRAVESTVTGSPAGRAASASTDTALADPEAFVRRTMGQSKISVFTELFAGDTELATQANAAFEDTFDRAVERGDVEPMPGAVAAIRGLQKAGIRVCLTTGFAPPTATGSSPPWAGRSWPTSSCRRPTPGGGVRRRT